MSAQTNFVNTGVTPIQPQSFFRYNKPEARPYVVVGPDPEHADFGPFTPGTKTWGLQEATNYAVANNISEIRCIGHAVIPNLNLNVGYNRIQRISEPVAIMIPLVDTSTSPLVVIRYVGVGAQGPPYELSSATEMGYPTNSETIFEITDTNDYRSTYASPNLTNGALFGTGNPSSFFLGHTNVQVEFENITFLSPNNGLPHTAVDGAAFAGLRMRNVSVDVKRTTTTAVTQPQTNAGVGVIFPDTGNNGVSEADSLHVTGYYRGIIYGTHFTAGIIHIYNCYYGLQPMYGNHAAQIFYADLADNVYHINAGDILYVPTSIGIPQVTTNIYMLDLQDTPSSQGTWNVTLAHIYANPSGAAGPAYPFVLNVDYLNKVTAYVGKQPPTLTVYYPNPSNIPLNINVKRPADPTFPFSQTIPVNPPASGTVYQNVNPYGIVLLIPVSLTPTSSASASASIAVGTSPSTLSTVQTLTQTAGASPTGGVLQAAVPSGQYYQITLTNATAYQAIVLPE